MGERGAPTDESDAVAAYIRRFADPPADELATFIAHGRVLSLAAGAPFVELGDDRHRLGFIHEGVLRYHLPLANGEDITKDFGFPGWFAVSFGSAVRAVPARVAISAVSPARLTVWPFEELARLIDSSASWQRFGRRVAEMLYVRKEEREISFLVEDAEQRYRALLHQFPQALELIPHYHLASYLGIRPQSLSRIRGRDRARGLRARIPRPPDESAPS
jgi:CRP-like cAMP-binding protein